MESQQVSIESDSCDSSYSHSLPQLAPPTPRLPERTGWLLKYTSNPFRRWQRRFFALSSKKLSYYHQEDDRKPAGSFNFDLISVSVQLIRTDSEEELILHPVFSQRKFRLRSEAEGELEDWAVQLSEHISTSAGRLKNLSNVSRQAKFWRWDRISNSQFHTIASTGDILLFQGKNLSARAQRLVTRSKYDHVAMILKYSTNEIALLEATSIDGVQVLLWLDFLRRKWHQLYTLLVYRPLEYQRTNEMLQTFRDFIDEVRGKKFNLTPMRLVGKQRDPQSAGQEGFFCSELLATAYKRIGILPSAVPASQYWPAQFSTEKKIDLLSGARLGEELLIEFEHEDYGV